MLLIWLWKRKLGKKRRRSMRSPFTGYDANFRASKMSSSGRMRGPLHHWLPRSRTHRSDRNKLDLLDGEPATPDMGETSAAPALRSKYSTSKQPSSQLMHNGHARGMSTTDIPSGHQPVAQQGPYGPSNPFSDMNAVELPATVSSLPPSALSFGNMPEELNNKKSGGASGGLSQYRPLESSAAMPHSTNRPFTQSTSSFMNKRDKVRSDPFDLELTRKSRSSQEAVPHLPERTVTSSIYGAHHPPSESSSRYTSKISSMGDWSLLHAGTALSQPAPATPHRVLSWDNPLPADNVMSGGRAPLPRTDQQPEVVFGQAL
jgi:hypothetical protein